MASWLSAGCHEDAAWVPRLVYGRWAGRKGEGHLPWFGISQRRRNSLPLH